MAKDNYQKIKLLKLYELLKQETDDKNSMATAEICRRLEEIGIPCDRRTLAKDIAVLNDYGYEIMTEMRGHEKCYYVADRSGTEIEPRCLACRVYAPLRSVLNDAHRASEPVRAEHVPLARSALSECRFFPSGDYALRLVAPDAVPIEPTLHKERPPSSL